MSKIFIDTDGWNQEFRRLNPGLKLLWFYMWVRTDKAGVYHIDPEILKLEIGQTYGPSDFKNLEEKMPGRIELLDKERVLMVDWLHIYCGVPNRKLNPHKPIFRDLKKNGLGYDEALLRPREGVVDKEEDVDVDKDNNKNGRQKKEDDYETPAERLKRDQAATDTAFSTAYFRGDTEEKARLTKAFNDKLEGPKEKYTPDWTDREFRARFKSFLANWVQNAIEKQGKNGDLPAAPERDTNNRPKFTDKWQEEEWERKNLNK